MAIMSNEVANKWTLVCAFGFSVLLAACGGSSSGGGGSNPPAAAPSSGVFVDSPVQGLGYKALPSGFAGTTDATGHYQYLPGDMVTFDIGRRIVGTVPAAPEVTALSVFGATSMTDVRVVNLAQLLLTFGGVPTGQNPIQLPLTIPAGLQNPLDFSDPNFTTMLQNALPGTIIVTQAQATTHLQSSFKTLAVTVVNSGIVTSTPAGINGCTATSWTCSYDFVTSTNVTLTALGTGFTGWTGGGCSGTGTCVVPMNADTAVTGSFPVAPPPATLTIFPNQGTGTGSVACSTNGDASGACSASYLNGTALVLQATANDGSTFSGWIDGVGNATVCNGFTGNCSMILTADSAVRGNFVLSTVTFSLTANTSSSNGGGGTIACSTTGGVPFGACAPSYNAGTTLTLQAVPNSASNFSGWGNGSGSGNGSPSACNTTTGLCTFTITANTSITANFNRPTLNVVLGGTGAGRVNSSPTGITNCATNCTASFDKGTTITLTASGAGFAGWSGGGCSGTGACPIRLNASTSVMASFPVQSLEILNGHNVVLDGSGQIIPWTPDPTQGYDHVMTLSWNYLLNSVPSDSQNGKPAYYSHSYMKPDTQELAGWPHNPAGLYGMLIESALKYYGYSGNVLPVRLAENVATAMISNGMTPAGGNWAKVPYASGDTGSLTYRGAAYGNSDGAGDGTGVIEPDKVGEMGDAWLQLYRFNGNTAFRDAAIAAADALASHVRTGNASQSPWPFRVYAATGVVREEYCANVIGAIKLFDGLIRLGLGNTGAYQTARQTAWNWLMAYPMQNNIWANYFEDVPIQPNTSNVNQYNAMMMARYLLEHSALDADWERHVRGLISWVEVNFAVSAYGANTIREQREFWFPMGSHTARYASVNALLYEKTGDAGAKEKAYRALNWATYMARPNGVVIDGPEVNNQWFTDGYGDYIRHFMTSVGAVPTWAPDQQNHLVRSTSIVNNITYSSLGITYSTTDGASTEIVRTNFTPASVVVEGLPLSQRADLTQAGWTFDPVLRVLQIRHEAGTNVQITLVPAAL